MRRKLNVKLLFWVAGTLLLAGGVVHLLHGYQLRQNASSLLDSGDRALEQGKSVEALGLYRQYLQYEPTDVDGLFKYARVLDRQAVTTGDRGRLILVMENVLSARPDEDELRLRLVHNLLLFRRLPDAMRHLQVLLERHKDRADLYHMLGWCQEARQQYKEAAVSFQKALRLDPQRLESSVLLAEVLQERLVQPEEALQVMDEMVRMNPASYRAYLNRARFQQDRQDEKKAGSDLKKAQELAPREPEVLMAAARWALAHGQREEAAALVRLGVGLHPESTPLIKALAELEAGAGRPAEAIALLREGLEKLPQAPDLLVLLTDLLIDAGPEQFPAAEQELVRLRQLPVPPALPEYLQARIDVGRGKWVAALALLERSRSELGPRSEWAGRVNSLLGACYRRAGDGAPALAAYRRAVEAEPYSTSARAGLGAALLENGRLQEALTELEALRTAPDLPANYWPLLCRALLWRTLGVPAERRTWNEVEAALAKASSAAGTETALLCAEVQVAKGDLAAARTALEQQMKKSEPAGGQVALWCALADLAYRQGREAQAESVLARAESALGDRPEIRVARCRLWSVRGGSEDQKKIARLEKGMDAFSAEDRLGLQRELADAWQRLGEGAQAARLWREIGRVQPHDLRSRVALLDLALETGQEDEARRLVAELRTLEGEEGLNWRFGRAALQARGVPEHLSAARRDLVELARQYKTAGRIPLLLARLDERQGQPQEAVQHYLQALELGAARPGVIRRLLQLLLERRDYARAEEALQLYGQRLVLTRDLTRLAAEVALGNQNKHLALERARRAAPLPSRDYRDYLWRAEVEQRAEALKDAEEHLRAAAGLAEYVPDVWVALAGLLSVTDRAAEAEPLLAEVRAKLPAAAVPVTVARCYEALRKPAQADEAYRLALAAQPDDLALLAAAAEFHRRAGHEKRAAALLHKLLEPQREAPPELAVRARRHLAVLLADAGDRPGAFDLLEANRQALGATVADERIRFFVLGSSGAAERGAALAGFQASLARQAFSADEQVLLARLYEAAGKLDQAREELAQIVALAGQAPEYLAPLVHILIRTDELAEAEAYLGRLEKREPGSTRLRSLQAALRSARRVGALNAETPAWLTACQT